MTMWNDLLDKQKYILKSFYSLVQPLYMHNMYLNNLALGLLFCNSVFFQSLLALAI
jgi:hypothetical protein